jgi:hypothetical protein
MRRVDPTFLLIKSLTKREKDLFVRYAGLEGQGSKSRKYVDLFRAIGKQKKYDEEELKKEFKGEGFAKNFSEAKRSLREVILKVLVYSVDNTEKELNFLLLQVEQLMQRGESELAIQLIEKGRALSDAEERYAFAVRFIDLEKRWLLMNGEAEQLVAEMQRLDREKKVSRDAETQLDLLRDLHDGYQPLLKASYNIRGEMDASIRAELAQHDLLAKAGKQQPTRIRFFHLRLQLIVALTEGRVKEGLKIASQVSELFESVAYLRGDYPEEFLRLQSNLCRLTLLSGDHELTRSRLEAFNALETETPYLSYVKAEHYYINTLDLCLASGDLRAGNRLMPEIESFLKEEEDRMKISRKFQYYNWLGRFHFMDRNFESAARWLKKALDHPPTRTRTDLQIVNRVTLLLVYHELGEWELMESLRRSTERFIGDIRNQRPAEKRILSFLNSKGADPSAPGYKKAVQDLHTDLQKILEGAGGAILRDYYSVLKWLNDKKK